MKTTYFLLSLALAMSGCGQTTQQADQEQTTAANFPEEGDTFGKAFPEANVMSVEELQQAVARKDSVQATVTAEIVESCQAKGCWMDVKLADNSTMKVKFRDYGFFLPTEDLSGRQVVFTGTAQMKTVSVADRKHYAEDAGKSEEEINEITTPSEELAFVADGVILR
ncbi:DUF4920 domain-containing protein [Pontibacter qinzhouensis]|nr:DUF4920 domain-containing protein [Pontibacter qinzhouensis]